MFILQFLPNTILIWVIHAILLIGIIGTIVDYFIYYIPGILSIRIPLKIISTLLLLVGVFFEGGYVTDLGWEGKVAEAEAKVIQAEAKSNQVDTVIKEKVV